MNSAYCACRTAALRIFVQSLIVPSYRQWQPNLRTVRLFQQTLSTRSFHASHLRYNRQAVRSADKTDVPEYSTEIPKGNTTPSPTLETAGNGNETKEPTEPTEPDKPGKNKRKKLRKDREAAIAKAAEARERKIAKKAARKEAAKIAKAARAAKAAKRREIWKARKAKRAAKTAQAQVQASAEATEAKETTETTEAASLQHAISATLDDIESEQIRKKPRREPRREPRQRYQPVQPDDAPFQRNAKPWQIQKRALREKFPEGWRPFKKLSPDALDGIRTLNRQYPDIYTTPVLAKHFKVSAEAVRRILRSKWTPSSHEEEDRQMRWFERGKKVWTRWAELGKKPPRRWREEGILRDRSWNDRRQRQMERRQAEESYEASSWKTFTDSETVAPQSQSKGRWRRLQQAQGRKSNVAEEEL